METHSQLSNELNEEIQGLKTQLSDWAHELNSMLEQGVDSLNERVLRDTNYIKDSSVRIDGLEKRIRDSQELSEIKRVVQMEQLEFKRCFDPNTESLKSKLEGLERQLLEDKRKLEREQLIYEEDLKTAKLQSLEREKNCRIYSENLGLSIGKVNGNNRFTFTCLDDAFPDKECYFDLYFNEQAQVYQGMSCVPPIKDFKANIELLNSKSTTFRKFLCNMRRSFQQEIRC